MTELLRLVLPVPILARALDGIGTSPDTAVSADVVMRSLLPAEAADFCHHTRYLWSHQACQSSNPSKPFARSSCVILNCPRPERVNMSVVNQDSRGASTRQQVPLET